MTGRIGQEVVCITDDPWVNGYTGRKADGPNPIKGEIYHYAGVHMSCTTGSHYIFLYEFGGKSGPAFEACAFRPVVKTDISIFTEILERENIPSTEKEKV